MLLEELEDMADIKAYDKVKSRPNEEFRPFRQAIDEIEKGLAK